MNQLPTGMMKWSSRPADDKRRRERDNQRRHRERVRSHVAQLEARLAETELQLRQALLAIHHLTLELNRARLPVSTSQLDCTSAAARCPSSLPPPSPAQTCSPSQAPSKPESPDDAVISHRPDYSECDGGEYLLQSTTDESRPQTAARCTASYEAKERNSRDDFSSSEESPLLAITSNSDPKASCGCDIAADEEACRNMPPPEAGESTTRCRDAYRLIMERNYSGWDNGRLHRWLGPGFRGPVVAGDGCRVENMLLFTVLDRITS
ncbi:hypothetical protein HIM_03059 [Hirsutella minnesotensis 3608]|nr:hypothetical protein HIM_03059 [Hirsutella minnesotensis 3608]